MSVFLSRGNLQLLSQSWNKKIKEALDNPGRILAVEPSFVRLSDNGNIPFFVHTILAPFGIITDVSRLFSMLDSIFVSCWRQYWWIPALSPFTMTSLNSWVLAHIFTFSNYFIIGLGETKELGDIGLKLLNKYLLFYISSNSVSPVILELVDRTHSTCPCHWPTLRDPRGQELCWYILRRYGVDT